MAGGPQKPDHGGNFYMVPRRMQASDAWRCLSLRARVVLQVLQFRHDGFNNGRLGITIHEIGAAVGGQNHGANGKAIAELIEKGFLECTADANRHQSKVRTYRLTFIPTGEGKRMQPATHEYKDWTPAPGNRKKFGGARTAAQTRLSVVETSTDMKFSATETAMQPTVIRGIESDCRVAATAPLLGNHSPSRISDPDRSAISLSHGLDLSTADGLPALREWARQVSDRLGTQKQLAVAASVPEPSLSRFLSGRGLAMHHREPLRRACANVIKAKDLQVAA